MITLSNLDKSFDGHRVLKNINLTIEEGTVTTLIGPSGSGKSTLLRCINLLEIPQAGTLTIGKESITFSPDARIKGRGYSPHQPSDGDGVPELRAVSAYDRSGKYHRRADHRTQMGSRPCAPAWRSVTDESRYAA